MKTNYKFVPRNLLDDETYNVVFDKLLERQKTTSSVVHYANQFRMASISYAAVNILETLKSVSPVMDKDLNKDVPKHFRKDALKLLELLGYIETTVHLQKNGKSSEAWQKTK